MVHCFLLFRPSCNGFVSHGVTCRINLEDLWSMLFINSYDDNVDAHGPHTHILSREVELFCALRNQHRHRDVVPILELELSAVHSHPGDDGLRIIEVACDHAADGLVDAEHMGHAVLHDQFVFDLASGILPSLG